MNRSIEQALTSLIPRHNGPLPPELIELSSSLLAQSRVQASNLKADEEIGRTYACANIACERLKQSLNLPAIEPRPPCPPRTYSKLYTYFNSILKAGRGPGRPRSAKSPVARPLPERKTPTKNQSLAAFRTDTPSRSAKRGLLFQDINAEIPKWIHPVIRALCASLNAPGAAPHILAGVTSILTLPCPALLRSRDGERADVGEAKKDKIPALIAAVWLFVNTRLRGEETSPQEYKVQRAAVLAILKEVKEELQGRKSLGDWESWEEVGPKDVDAWLKEIQKKGWTELDWFENIVEGSGVGLEREEGEILGAAGDDDDDGDEELIARRRRRMRREDENHQHNGLQVGLGTMMQDNVDYLSEKKRAEYKIWKAGIMRRIQDIEAKSHSHEPEAVNTSGT